MKAAELEKRLGKKKLKTVSDLRQVISTRTDQNPNFCLFLGAGASRTSGIRTAGEMVKEWVSQIYCDLNQTNERLAEEEMRKWLSQNAAEWYDDNRPYATLIEKIYPLPTHRRKFIETEVAEKIPSIGYAYLVRLAEAGLLRTIFTTNFDDLLNEAFYQFSSKRALVCAHDSSVHTIGVTSGRTKIIKLHGDYLFDDLKNTQNETRKLDENMEEKFEEFLKEYGLIITGYSGGDKSIMRILQDMSDRHDLYLRNGLYWCFRPQDEISSDTLDILECDNSFFVLISGFDELMADLYSMLPTMTSPFNAKLASDRASAIIDTYLQSSHLKSSGSPIIKKHLQALEADKNASLLSDLMKHLNSARIASSGLTDEHLLVYLEIERALAERRPDTALARIVEEVEKTTDPKFKDILLYRFFFCALRLNNFKMANEAIKQMLQSEPKNYLIALNACSLMENRADRVSALEKLKAEHPYAAVVFSRYAEELDEALDKKDKIRTGLEPEDVVLALKRSLEIDPSLENPAWSQLFDFYAKPASSSKNRELISEIVGKHLHQNAYDAKSMALLFRYCRKYQTTEFNGTPLVDYLSAAYVNHFPRDYAAHLEVYVDACIEFGMDRTLRPLLEEAQTKQQLRDDPQFVAILMDVHYDVCRNLSAAIECGKEYLRTHKAPNIEVKLLEMYLEKGELGKARDIHNGLKGAIDLTRWYKLQANIFEYEGKFQDAIDVIESIPNRRDFEENYVAELSYLELRLNSPARALKRCREFLTPRSFCISFEAVIINHEYSKLMDKGNVHKERVGAVLKATNDEMVKAVCHTLLGNTKEALKILRAESEKRYSRVVDCLRWPALSSLKTELSAIRDDLESRKRTIADLAKGELCSTPVAMQGDAKLL